MFCVALSVPQSKHTEALHAFAEDVYYCSVEYGAEDVRTSLGYYNMGKVGAGSYGERSSKSGGRGRGAWLQRVRAGQAPAVLGGKSAMAAPPRIAQLRLSWGCHAQVFQAAGDAEKAASCNDQVRNVSAAAAASAARMQQQKPGPCTQQSRPPVPRLRHACRCWRCGSRPSTLWCLGWLTQRRQRHR